MIVLVIIGVISGVALWRFILDILIAILVSKFLYIKVSNIAHVKGKSLQIMLLLKRIYLNFDGVHTNSKVLLSSSKAYIKFTEK